VSSSTQSSIMRPHRSRSHCTPWLRYVVPSGNGAEIARRTATRVFQGQPPTSTSSTPKVSPGSRWAACRNQARKASLPRRSAPRGVSPTKRKCMSSWAMSLAASSFPAAMRRHVARALEATIIRYMTRLYE
jgi:hypothetical protein